MRGRKKKEEERGNGSAVKIEGILTRDRPTASPYSFDDPSIPLPEREPTQRGSRLFPDSHFLSFQEGIGSLKVVPGGIELRGQAAVLDALVASSLRSRRGKNLVLESWNNFTASARSHDGRLLARFTVGKSCEHDCDISIKMGRFFSFFLFAVEK